MDGVIHLFSGESLILAFERREAFAGSLVRRFFLLAAICLCLIAFVGCGATKSYIATDQLLMSDAVDATVAKLDFTPLKGENVYLDATYIKTMRSPLLVDSDYVISSLRQQMVASGVMLAESRDEADIIAEARLGALGLDGHNVSYGIPASSTLSSATGLFANAPPVPTIPEISLARHEAKSGAAKIAVFAYEKSTKKPVWQSGIARSKSSARDTWVLGAGPWQRGTIYEGTQFAGKKFLEGLTTKEESTSRFRMTDEYTTYVGQRTYDEKQESKSEQETLLAESESSGDTSTSDAAVVTASAVEPATKNASKEENADSNSGQESE